MRWRLRGKRPPAPASAPPPPGCTPVEVDDPATWLTDAVAERIRADAMGAVAEHSHQDAPMHASRGPRA